MQSLLCNAIAERKIITFSYKGGRRTVEPHMVAFNTQGKLTLSAWFLQGASDSKESQGWRAYLLEEISGISVSEQRFSTSRPGYQRDGGKSFNNIQCAL